MIRQRYTTPNFDARYSVPRKIVAVPEEEILTKKCRRCHAIFITGSRIRKRCDACQTIVSAEKQKRTYERLKRRRKAAREKLLR